MNINIEIPLALLTSDQCQIHVRVRGDAVDIPPQQCSVEADADPPDHGAALFLDCIDNCVAELMEQKRERTAETYQSARNSLAEFLGDTRATAMQITPALMDSYQRWLTGRGLSMNTVSFYMRVLRSVYNRVVDAGLSVDNRPFRRVYTGIARTRKRALQLEELGRLMALRPTDRDEAMALDLFLFSFYTRGMSLIDIAFLRKADLRDGIVTYCRRKTGQQLRIGWTDDMQRIADRLPSKDGVHLLGLVDNGSQVDVRRQLKRLQARLSYRLERIGQKAGLGSHLTMYVARHSWASAARDLDVPMGIISDGMGHTTEKTTHIYLRSIGLDKIDRESQRVIDAVKGSIKS